MQPQSTIQPQSSILIVDDTQENLQLLVRMLKEHGYKTRPVTSGSLALDAIRQAPPDLILLDINMPEMDGYEVCKQLKTEAKLKDIPVIFISAMNESIDKIKAFGAGGVDYVTKPFQAEEVEARVKTHLDLYRQKRVERELLEKTLNGSIKLLTDIQGSADPHSFSRARRLRDLTTAFVQFAGLDSAWEYELAAMLSPIGLVLVPPAVINRSRQGLGLSNQESAMMERVPEMGHNLLSNIPRLESVAQMVLYQNKSFNGEGFPYDSVCGEKIPLGARILKILADLVKWEERQLSVESAFARMQLATGDYDPQLLRSIAGCFSTEGLPAIPQAPVTEVPVDQLLVGDVLRADVMSTSGNLVLPVKTVISTMLLIRLRNFGELGGIVQPIKIVARA